MRLQFEDDVRCYERIARKRSSSGCGTEVLILSQEHASLTGKSVGNRLVLVNVTCCRMTPGNVIRVLIRVVVQMDHDDGWMPW